VIARIFNGLPLWTNFNSSIFGLDDAPRNKDPVAFDITVGICNDLGLARDSGHIAQLTQVVSAMSVNMDLRFLAGV
jgi:hypothetical protein